MLNKISILIVNYNSSDFVINTINCLNKITKNPYQILIADNNSNLKDYIKLEKESLKHKNIDLERLSTNKTGSLAHGEALNHLVKKVTTPYFSVLDADAIWLKKNWDEILIKKITDKIKIIGTQADGPTKPQDFPAIYGFLTETSTFKGLNINLEPKNIDNHQDTGWEMREKFLANGLNGEILFMKNTREFKKGPFAKLIGVCEYYDKNGNLFISHFGRGSSLGSAKYRKSWKKYIYSIPKIGKWLIKNKGNKEKKKWISISKRIINKND